MVSGFFKIMRRAGRGITLFEMIVVLTVTMILSLIFIYSTKHIVVRTKLERVKEEHRVLSRALQNYRMDYNEYPSELRSLKAPTAYLSSLPLDPFLDQRFGKNDYVYYYHPSEECEYIIVSAGPDGDLDLNEMLENSLQFTAGSPENRDALFFTPRADDLIDIIFPAYLAVKTYDPTNGVNSDGDIITYSSQ